MVKGKNQYQQRKLELICRHNTNTKCRS